MTAVAAARTSAALEYGYAHAERVTAYWARSFHFASRFLPRAKRRAVFALYDYCRHADNLVDLRGMRPVPQVRADLAALAAEVRAIHAGGRSSSGRWLALADTLRRFDVPLDPLLRLLDGVAMDLEPVAIRDFGELRRYCELVAGGVGLMLGPVLGAEPGRFREPGVGLGVAMQLTNVLRDVAEDLDAGRLYLPLGELAAFGLTRSSLEARRMTPALVAFVRFQVARARAIFAAADPVVSLFPHDGSRMTVRLMQRTYAGILDSIERRGYDLFRGRAYVSASRKLIILGCAMWQELPRLALAPPERIA